MKAVSTDPPDGPDGPPFLTRTVRGTITPRARGARGPGCYRYIIWRSEDGGRATGGLDLVLGGGRELVSRDAHLDGDLAGAQHLDELPVADGPLGHQVLDRHVAALREEHRDAVKVDDLVLGAEGVLEATELGKPHVHRHLPALEALGNLVARLRALGTAASGLSLAALAATHTGLGGLGTGSGAKVVNLQRGRFFGHVQSTSSTATRCLTVLTIPRISGRSSLTTTSWTCFRPRERSVSRWFCSPPIPERVWVTFKRVIMHLFPQREPAAWLPGRRVQEADHGGRQPLRDAQGHAAQPLSREPR